MNYTAIFVNIQKQPILILLGTCRHRINNNKRQASNKRYASAFALRFLANRMCGGNSDDSPIALHHFSLSIISPHTPSHSFPLLGTLLAAKDTTRLSLTRSSSHTSALDAIHHTTTTHSPLSRDNANPHLSVERTSCNTQKDTGGMPRAHV